MHAVLMLALLMPAMPASLMLALLMPAMPALFMTARPASLT